MKYFLSLLALAFTCNAYSQITLVDTPHCLNHTLHGEVTGGIIPTSSGITVDDGWSGTIPIGFSYNFYGAPNTQCIIGSNGCLGFNLASAGAYNTWPISSTLATTTATDIRNVICGPWCDVYILAGGTIDYSMQGTAPNRNFAVTWCGTHMFGCTTEWLTTQIIIYETTGIAEVHIQHRTICSTGWNGSRAEIGVKNAAGTVSTSPATRDYAPTWVVSTPEGWRFTPIAGPSYSVTPIPYAPIPYAASGIYWYDSATHAYLGSGPNITINPAVPTTYMAAALGCNDTTKAYIHVLPSIVAFGGAPHISTTNITAVNPTVCGKNDGYITLHGITPHNVDSVFYSIGGVAQPVFIDSAHLDSTISFPNLCANTYDYFYYKVGNCPSNQVGPITLTTPPIRVDLNYWVDMKCDGDLVYFTNLSTPYTIDYTPTWDFGDGTPTSNLQNPVHTYTAQGTYTVHLKFASNYSGSACPGAGNCYKDTSFTVALNHPLYDSFTVDYNQVCVGMPLTFSNYSTSSTNGVSTTGLLKYYWEFANNANDTVINPVYTFPSPGMYDVKLTITDTIGCQKTFDDSVMIIYIGVRTRVHDTSVCLTDSMSMLAYVEVIPEGRLQPTYLWSPANNIGQTDGLGTNFFGLGTFIYTITATTPPMASNANGCIATDTERIVSYPPVTLTNLTSSPTAIPFGGSIQLSASGAVYYTWKPDNGTLDNNNINNPVASPVDPSTVYTVYGMNLYGCVDSANITITLDNTMFEGMPTGFTPNGDNLNDIFKITKLKFPKLVDFRIFNRWGQEVFQTANPEVGWDGTYHGTPQDIGVYNWIITLGYVNGENKTFKGTVTLIR